MASEGSSPIVFFTLIAGRKQKDALVTLLLNIGAQMIDTVYGKGSAKTSPSLMEAFGFVPEENKVIITCLLPRKKADAALEVLVKKFNFDKPNTGIAFTVAVDCLSF
ncbi:MAG: hypothetical protein ACOX0U_00705 [Oscillospiraceae bacterium]|jgi:hypothetical protein